MRIPIHYAVLAVSLVTGTIVVPALAQESQDLPVTRIVSSAKATPNKAGTPAHPRGMAITASAKLIVKPDVDPPVVTRIDILIGRGLHWNEGKYATCTKQTLDRHGPSGCPRQSIMGAAKATGMADTVPARVDMVFANGGPGTMYIYASLNNPARVRETLVLKTTSLRSGPWGQSETVEVPRSLQIVAGIPIRLDRITLQMGGKSYAKDFIASTSCPAGGWKYRVTAHYAYDVTSNGQTADNVSAGRIACRK